MLNRHLLFKRLGVLCAVLMLLAALALPAFADTGPKPSVQIRFRNLPDATCYGTLLSETSSTGPASAWDGDPATAYDDASPDNAVWRAFVHYQDEAGFFFLQQSWRVTSETPLRWTYYPPQTFRVLLWFPETNTFVCSETLERYAFDSYFTAELQTGTDGATAVLTVQREAALREEIFPFAARVVLTLAVELLAALLFGLRKKGQLGLIVGVNLATQLLLNLAVQLLRIPTDPARYLIGYLLLELLIFALEAAVYCIVMPRLQPKGRARAYYVLYAFVANAASFGAGLLLSRFLPQLF